MGIIKEMWKELFDIEPQERVKIFFLWIIFFLVIGSYTITRDIKSSMFMAVVGKSWVNIAKWLSMLLLVPLILFYARLVDNMKRYQLLSLYSAIFGVVSLLLTWFIADPIIGLPNTDKSPWRLFGWFFYFFVECYSPFVVSLFWAFANSITSPEGAKKNYGIIVSGSKVGGMITAGLAWYLFALSARNAHQYLSDVVAHQIIMLVSSIMVLLVPLFVILLIRKVPAQHLHGYEAAYQLDKKHEKQDEKPGLLSGLFMMIKQPYVLGIFSLIFFYEVINTVLSFLRLGVAESNAQNISDVSRVLFKIIFKTHAIGLVVALIGTRTLYQRLGTSFCLLLIPLLTGGFLLYLMVETTEDALINAFVLVKAIHYAFSWPVRESLYIPTVKEIKFKSRSWIDAFGSKFARSSGSAFNILSTWLGDSLILPIHSFFFAIIIGAWFVTSFFVGRRFERAIANNEVIGAEDNQ